MQTRTLYYEDCHKKVFSATVVDCREAEKGFWACLDATAFYPEGGGQPCDLGVLNNIPVLDVREKENRVWHLMEAPLQIGQTVTGEIDWQRRLDLMQQHTGEHIVSGVIHRLLGGQNTGFHMGADVITIDFDVPIDVPTLEEIEKQANQAVFENLAVRCYVPSKTELPTIPYRSKRALPWPVRLVEIPGYDTCACCGVHTKTTGEIGMIKLLSCVKFHQGVRLEMVCGGRALAYLSDIYRQNKLVSQAFSAKVLETGEAAQRMNQALSEEKFRSANLEKRLLAHIGRQYENAGNVVCFDNLLPARPLAEQIARTCGGVAVVFSGDDKQGYSFCLMCENDEVSTLGKALTQSLSGRGGGRDGFFQGSLKATERQIRDCLEKNIDFS